MQLTKVTFYGALGDDLGRSEWSLLVESVGEALQAVECQTQRLFQHLETAKTDYRVILDGKDHDSVEQLKFSRKTFKTIEIVPVPEGSGGAGVWEIVAGVVLIAVGIVFSTYLGPLATPIVMAGVGLLLGGVSSLLFPAHNLQAQQSKQPDKKTSYLFNGAANTTGQGECVPVVYGEMMTGSIVVAAQLSSYEIANDGIAIGETQTARPATDYTTSANWVVLHGRIK